MKDSLLIFESRAGFDQHQAHARCRPPLFKGELPGLRRAERMMLERA